MEVALDVVTKKGAGKGTDTGVETAVAGEDSGERACADFRAGIRRDESFEKIVKRYYEPVRGFFARRIFSPDDCMELTQDVFLRVYKGLSSFRGEALFRTWLFRIVHNTYLKWLRGRRKMDDHGPEISTQKGHSQTPAMDEQQPTVAVSETQLDGLLQQERSLQLRVAIAELSPQMQDCIKLRIYHDCSYAEIAEFKQLSIETVKVHLHRARKALTTKLTEHFRDIEF